MRGMSLSTILLAACLCAATSVQLIAQTPAPISPVETQPAPVTPLFDCYHINFAWGFSLSGRMVDADGTVYTYTKPTKPWLAHETSDAGNTYLGDADLQAKFALRKNVATIDAATLAAKRALVEGASRGKVTMLDGGARDAGSSSCHVYIHDAAKARYRDVNLGSDSGVNDVRVQNDAPQAKELLAWLETLRAAVK